MVRTLLSATVAMVAILVGVSACGEGASSQPSGGGGANGGGEGGASVGGVARLCDSGEEMLAAEIVPTVGVSGGNVYAHRLTAEGQLELVAISEDTGAIETLNSTRFLIAGDGLSPYQMDIGEAGGAMVTDLMVDDRDDYVYFAGNRHIWRIAKAGGEPERVSVEPLNGWLDRCGFIPDVLAEDAVYTCRNDTIYRVARAAESPIEAVYTAEGSEVLGFQEQEGTLYIGSEGGLETLDLSTQSSGSIAVPPEAAPAYLLRHEDQLYFNSLQISAASDASGVFQVDLGTQDVVQLSEITLNTVDGAEPDAEFVYWISGSREMARLSTADGTYQTFVDCSASDLGTIRTFALGPDSVYVVFRDNGVMRFAK